MKYIIAFIIFPLTALAQLNPSLPVVRLEQGEIVERRQSIPTRYGSTVNYRFGAEGKLKNWRVRGGYAHQGDPFVDNSGFNQSTQQLSGGIGVQFDALRVDFSLVNQNFNSLYRSYKVLDRNGMNYGPLTEIKNSITSAVVTVGFNF